MQREPSLQPFSFDIKAFAADIDQLRSELRKNTGSEDLNHFKTIERFVWALACLGLMTAWVSPNPIAILAFATASFARWTILSHHICHRGYEKIQRAPERYNSKTYARGWRRYFHWLDWIHPDAWHHEHDILHHYNLGEVKDPDVPQNRFEWMARSKMPFPLRVLFVFFSVIFWKPFYYAPNTLNALLNKREGTEHEFGSLALWSPFRKRFWQVVLHCWLPYIGIRFVLFPACFLFVSPEAATAVLINLLVAEIVSNVWTFLVIVPNHAGSDIFVFEQHPKNRAEFYLHQVVGSVNYRCGGNVRDFLQGWLNYQIEHHLFPDLSLLQYQKAHPRVREICEKHGVPMVCEPLMKRCNKLLKIMTGQERQPTWPGDIPVEVRMAS